MRQLVKNGHAAFWVVLRGNADVSSAASIRNRSSRGVQVYERLTSYARESQAPLRSWLDAQNIRYQPYWIVNAIFVKSADQAQLEAIAARPDVKLIRANHSYPIPDENLGAEKSKASPSTTEWGLNAINAPQVWSTFNDRGEGIVISSIDTGVRYSHQALVGKYRGNLGGGNFDHNYNWWDPLHECPTGDPCDTDTHGTHTMGTMVGDDGDPGANQIGVAPHATWILAKGCCLDTALISSGQWILAPTDSSGNNPRPDLRPDIVNNSWAADPATRSSSPRFRPGSLRASSRRSRTATRGRRAGLPALRVTFRRRMPRAHSTSTATSPASRHGARRLLEGSSSRTSRLPARTCARR